MGRVTHCGAGPRGPQVRRWLPAPRRAQRAQSLGRCAVRLSPEPFRAAGPASPHRSARIMACPQARAFGLLLVVVTATLAAAQQGNCEAGTCSGGAEVLSGRGWGGDLRVAPRPDGSGRTYARMRQSCGIPGGDLGPG